MLDENELLFDELYEKTKDCGRTQFIRLLMSKERENKQLKHIPDELEKWLEEKKLRNTPKARWKHYNKDGFHDYDVENGGYIEMQPVNITLTEVINKLKELRGGVDNE